MNRLLSLIDSECEWINRKVEKYKLNWDIVVNRRNF